MRHWIDENQNKSYFQFMFFFTKEFIFFFQFLILLVSSWQKELSAHLTWRWNVFSTKSILLYMYERGWESLNIKEGGTFFDLCAVFTVIEIEISLNKVIQAKTEALQKKKYITWVDHMCVITLVNIRFWECLIWPFMQEFCKPGQKSRSLQDSAL